MDPLITDVDECLSAPSVCGPNSTCTNKVGGYSCSCLNESTATNSSLNISANSSCVGKLGKVWFDVVLMKLLLVVKCAALQDRTVYQSYR